MQEGNSMQIQHTLLVRSLCKTTSQVDQTALTKVREIPVDQRSLVGFLSEDMLESPAMSGEKRVQVTSNRVQKAWLTRISPAPLALLF